MDDLPEDETVQIPEQSDAVDPRQERESCIECVEKHLGAAMVQLGEMHNGYRFNLLFVGHLHEAEDESRIWFKLHTAIREARKMWQTVREEPDWETLGRLVDETKAYVS